MSLAAEEMYCYFARLSHTDRSVPLHLEYLSARLPRTVPTVQSKIGGKTQLALATHRFRIRLCKCAGKLHVLQSRTISGIDSLD